MPWAGQERGRKEPACLGLVSGRQRVCPSTTLWVPPTSSPIPARPLPPTQSPVLSAPAGVIAAVAFVLVCLLFLMLHYMYRHKGTYHTNEAKGTEFAESADAALQDDPSLQDNGDSSRKEYFI